MRPAVLVVECTTHCIVGCVLILFSLSLSLQPLLVQVLPVVLMDNTPLADWVRNGYLSYREMGDICPREGKRGYNSYMYVCEIIIMLGAYTCIYIYIYMLIVFLC